jgi:hypothetical protein
MTRGRSRTTLASGVLAAAPAVFLAAWAGVARSQEAARTAPADSIAPAAGTAPADSVPTAAGYTMKDGLPCPDCDPRKKYFVVAGMELVTSMVIPWAYNYYVRDAEFARVSLDSWWDNITGAWEWDDNNFKTNQFAHPYHGATYFNSFRTNGYNFWASSGAAWVGAYLWECCGETHPPAQNDLLNTALGGISLGEMMYKVSSVILDNESHGRERTFREIGGFIVDPWRGFNRLIRGQTHGRRANPPDHKPSWIQGMLNGGYVWFGDTGPVDSTIGGALIGLQLAYGNPLEDYPKRPFSTFTVLADWTSAELDTVKFRFYRISTRGNLTGKALHRSETSAHTLGVSMNYDYYNNPTYHMGQQSFGGGLLSAWKWKRGTRLLTQVFARLIAIGAVQSDYYIVTGEGRDYDYGPGLGAQFQAVLLQRGLGGLTATYDLSHIYTVNGDDSNHYLQNLMVQGLVEINEGFGVGGKYLYFHRKSEYAGYPTSEQSAPQFQVYFSTALPNWNL